MVFLTPWWRHQMETFSALLAICAGNSPATGEFPAQWPVTRRFDVVFGLRLNKRLSKQSWSRWFETLSSPLWSHCNGWARFHDVMTSGSTIHRSDSAILLYPHTIKTVFLNTHDRQPRVQIHVALWVQNLIHVPSCRMWCVSYRVKTKKNIYRFDVHVWHFLRFYIIPSPFSLHRAAIYKIFPIKWQKAQQNSLKSKFSGHLFYIRALRYRCSHNNWWRRHRSGFRLPLLSFPPFETLLQLSMVRLVRTQNLCTYTYSSCQDNHLPDTFDCRNVLQVQSVSL